MDWCCNFMLKNRVTGKERPLFYGAIDLVGPLDGSQALVYLCHGEFHRTRNNIKTLASAKE